MHGRPASLSILRDIPRTLRWNSLRYEVYIMEILIRILSSKIVKIHIWEPSACPITLLWFRLVEFSTRVPKEAY